MVCVQTFLSFFSSMDSVSFSQETKETQTIFKVLQAENEVSQNSLHEHLQVEEQAIPLEPFLKNHTPSNHIKKLQKNNN